MKTVFLFLLVVTANYSQVSFDEYFEDNTLRLDYYHTGDKENDFYSFDEMIEEPYWGGSRVNLVDKFDYGTYHFKVFDEITGTLIYSRGYSTLFNEWQTTEEAKHTTKSFSETVLFPYPKNQVRVEFYGRDKKNNLIKKFEFNVDPDNYFIKTERRDEFESFEVIKSGDPSVKVDIVVIPDFNPWKSGEFGGELCFYQSYLKLSQMLEETPYSIYSGFWGAEEPNPTIRWIPYTKDISKALLIGDDNFLVLEEWKDYTRLLRSIQTLYVVPRNHPIDAIKAMRRRLCEINSDLEIEILDEHRYQHLSSTELRKR